MANTESIQWYETSVEMPDAEQTVLMLMPDADEPVWLGWFDGPSPDGDRWFHADGSPVGFMVTHWAELPAGPDA